MIECEERKITVGKYELTIREMTVSDEAKLKAEARVVDPKKKTVFKIDHGKIDAGTILHSVVPSTWPAAFGEFSLENIESLPSKYFRRILIEANKLNSIKEEVLDFLESPSSSATNQVPLPVQ